MGFFDDLEARCREVDSLLCIGLDPRVERLASSLHAVLEQGREGLQVAEGERQTGRNLDLEKAAQEAREFCFRLIEATADQAAAFKPNSAFFEALGAPGLEVLQEVIAAIPPGIPVILDAKRGDIASTAEAYAWAVFGLLGATAVTASPYLGYDSLEPFFAYPGRGVFLLCKTSNPGSADLQDLPLAASPGQPGGILVYEAVARLAVDWSRRLMGNQPGLVVGATQPEALGRVRSIASQLWILAPGVGAQGGDLQAALRAGLRADGLGLLLPVSRQVASASDPRLAAQELRQAISQHRLDFLQQGKRQPTGAPDRRVFARAKIGDENLDVIPGASIQDDQPEPGEFERSESRQVLAAGLLQAGCVQFGNFRLKSGLESPIYIDLRRLAGYPELLKLVASAYLPVLRNLDFQRIAALPYAALPIATAISLQAGWSMVYPRKEVKAYGTRAEIEGVYQPGERVAVVDDLITTGESKFEAVERLRSAGLLVQDIVVLIDRQSGAAQALKQAGLHLHAVFTLGELLDMWETGGSVSAQEIAAARQFIRSTQAL